MHGIGIGRVRHGVRKESQVMHLGDVGKKMGVMRESEGVLKMNSNGIIVLVDFSEFLETTTYFPMCL